MKNDIKRIAGIASFLQREDLIFYAISNIAYQVDIVYLYLNDFNEKPLWLNMFNNVNVILGKDALGDIADNGKFYMIEKENGFYFCIDDDMIYPSNYCDFLIDQYYKNPGVVGFHGVKIKKFPIKSYYNSPQDFEHYAWSYNIKKSVGVDIISTNACLFNTNDLKLSLNIFKESLMTDIYFSVSAQLQNVKRTVIPHDQNYLLYNPKMKGKWTICNKFYISDDEIYKGFKDRIQTDLINSTNWNS